MYPPVDRSAPLPPVPIDHRALARPQQTAPTPEAMPEPVTAIPVTAITWTGPGYPEQEVVTPTSIMPPCPDAAGRYPAWQAPVWPAAATQAYAQPQLAPPQVRPQLPAPAHNHTGGYPTVPPTTGGYPTVPPTTGGYATVPPMTGGYPTVPTPPGGYPTVQATTGGYATVPATAGVLPTHPATHRALTTHSAAYPVAATHLPPPATHSTPTAYGLPAAPAPAPHGLQAVLPRAPHGLPAAPSPASGDQPARSRPPVGVLLLGLLIGLLVFGSTGYLVGSTSGGSTVDDGTAAGGNSEAANRQRVGALLAPLAEGWVPWLGACLSSSEAAGPKPQAGERLRVRCAVDATVDVFFVQFASAADRDRAKATKQAENAASAQIAAGAAPVVARKAGTSGRTTGAYIEFAYQNEGRTYGGIWWDDSTGTGAAYVEKQWAEGDGGWRPLRDLWQRYT